MADTDVENVLLEIRERVRAESALRRNIASQASGSEGEEFLSSRENHDPTSEALARMHANLATTERAWNRLPPLLSNRSGWVARLELWVKRKIKRVTHWFTWEQINFNSSVHHALRDAMAALSAQDQKLAAARVEVESLRGEQESFRKINAEARSQMVTQMSARMGDVEARLLSELERMRADFSTALGGANESSRAASEELQKELRERSTEIFGELRVCFKQLSLEAGEAAVMQERSRRLLEERLDALEKVVKRK